MTKAKLMERLTQPFVLAWERDRGAVSQKSDSMTLPNKDLLGKESNTEVASPHVKQLDAASFLQTIQHGLVLVDFDEPWCGPCRIQRAVLENLADQIDSDTTLAEVNIDAAPSLAMQYRVESIPTLLLFRDGQSVGRFLGVQDEHRLAMALKAIASR